MKKVIWGKRLAGVVLGAVTAFSMVFAPIHSYAEEGGKQVIEYFGNWHETKLSDLPWDSFTQINHSFWHVVPDTSVEGISDKTTFEAKADGDEARTAFKIEPMDTVDLGKGNYFEQYAKLHKKYPDVKIMLSIGGWSGCGFFSEMAYTEEGRKSFVQSCIDTMNEYPWLAGIDIDWEYPGNNVEGEDRWPAGEGDEGCPLFGTPLEDMLNFNYLLRDMREGFDAAFPDEHKILTSCCSASTGWTLPAQDWKTASKYLDTVNVMSYDMWGGWEETSGHHTSVYWAKSAVAYLRVKGVPKEKINIGVAYYTHTFTADDPTMAGTPGAPSEEDYGLSEELTFKDCLRFEKEAVAEGTPGWHGGYDEKDEAAYLYNDDPNSEYYGKFVSYDNERSVSKKIDFVKDQDLAGVIVWEINQDSDDFILTKKLGDAFIEKSNECGPVIIICSVVIIIAVVGILLVKSKKKG